MPKILVLAVDGLFDSSLAITLDVLATANLVREGHGRRPAYAPTLFCPGRRRIRTANGGSYAVVPKVQPGRFDALVVPGFGLGSPEAIEAFFDRPLVRSVVDWLGRAGPRIPRIAASCSAVFAVAEAGLLDDEEATTSWWLAAEFRRRHPRVRLDETRMTLTSGNVLTSGASFAQLDLMLHLLTELDEGAIAEEVAHYLVVDRRPSQARFMALSAVAGMPAPIREVERWVKAHLARSFRNAELAAAVGMSARTLDRRVREATGAGVTRLVQRVRAEEALHLLQTTKLTVDEIAGRVGYANGSTLRRLLRRHAGAGPSALRRDAVALGP